MSGGVNLVEIAPAVVARVWCFDCHDRREPWVIRCLGGLGVTFRHVVLEAACACQSCGAELRLGLHAVSIRIPVTGPGSREASPGEPQCEAHP